MSVDLSVSVGSITLPNPVMVASGTAGHSTELSAYLDLAGLGAFVVKSLSADPWDGNPGPRIHQTPAGMINSVGLQGPGVAAWLGDGLARLRRIGVERIVVSIWGRTVDEYRRAARMLAEAPASVIGVEVNLSCPNLDGGRHLFAHDPDTAAEVIEVCGVADRPLWAKLSPNTDRTAEVAGAVAAAGAEAVTLTNTLLGMSIDPETRRPRLGSGAGGGGVSGPAIHPVAVRAVYDCRVAHPDLPIIGVGGVATAADAVEFLLAGAQACQVGTATFADPRAPRHVLDDLRAWCEAHKIDRVRELSGGAHG
jgi:dihydroorotate dehydrogenase (NAD+) catalytic subunit